MNPGSLSLPLDTATLVRLAVSLAAIPLLYRALREESPGGEENPRAAAGRSFFRRVFFALLGAFVLFQLADRWVPEQRSPSAGRGFESYVQGVLSLRMSHTPLAELSGELEEEKRTRRGKDGGKEVTPGEKAVAELQKAADLFPESAYFQRVAGIALADQGRYEAALPRLEKAMDVLEKRSAGRARQERLLWRSLFGPEPPTREAVEGARRQFTEYRMGWIGKVAILAAYRRLGPEAVPRDLRRQVEREASGYLQGLASGGVVPLLILPQLGLIVIVVGAVLMAQRVLQAVPQNQHPVSGLLWESFILLLALPMLPVMWAFGGQRPSPETQPAAFAGLILIGDLFQLPAIAYLWLRLRGRGLTLDEVGFSTRNLGANIGFGVLAAVVIIPGAHLVGILSQLLSDRYFPNIAPPYHPLNGMTATSTSVEIRTALFVAAAVGAPLLEELFFRGALFGALRRRHGFWIGMLASSAFFALLHPQLPLGFLPIAFLAMGFCALYEWRQSLIPGIVVHAINNGMAFLMLSLLFPMRG